MIDQKIYTKNEVHYIDDHGASSEQCSKCIHYKPYGPRQAFCKIVEGLIKPGGWCNRFKRAVTVPS